VAGLTVKSISVLIPTAHQPTFLKTALESVAAQSAVDHIQEVLVSENLMDPGSEVVCKQFKRLPIRYIFRDPVLSKVQHFNSLYNEASGDLVAILCDDDWWGQRHLENALGALKGNRHAVASASAVLHVPEDKPWTGHVSWSPVLWILANQPSTCTTWCFSSEQMMAAAWIQTPFHISTLVIRRHVLQSVVSTLSDLHSYQDDRMLQVQLGALGSILYEPLVGTCVRAHGEALTCQFSKVEREREFRKCTSRIQEMSKVRDIDVAKVWKQYIGALRGPIVDDLGKAFRMSLGDQDLRDNGFEQFLLPHPVVRILERGRTILKNRCKT
jgi:hypothetical protein